MAKVTVLLADGFEEVEAITPIDFLRRADVEVIVVGVTGPRVSGGHGVVVNADMTLDQVSPELIADLDGIVIPGGTAGAENIAASSAAVEMISACLESGKLVAAICAAPGVVLGGHDLVRGKAFTCYPGFQDRVSDGAFSTERVVEDGNLITSRGPGTAAEFALAIIARLRDPSVADQIRKGTLQPV